MNLHLNITQDIGHGITIIFICCIIVVVAVIFDLQTGVNAAKRNNEKIRSRILRRTIAKVLDYLRVVFFGVMIDVLGLNFEWYAIPYCAIIVTLGVILIEVKSVLENYRKSKSAAAEVPDMIKQIISAVTEEEALKLIRDIKASTKK
jgi:ABC-type bacteriocin/lantibiotic exporter with double-glycine peptidase domain